MISLVEFGNILQPAGSLCRKEVTLKHFIAAVSASIPSALLESLQYRRTPSGRQKARSWAQSQSNNLGLTDERPL